METFRKKRLAGVIVSIMVLVIILYGLIVSTFNLRLELLAKWKLKNLIETRYFEHDNKGGGFKAFNFILFDNATFRTRSIVLGGGLWHAGEILYHGPCDYDLAIEKWNESESHEVILNDKSWADSVSVVGKVGENECYIVNEYARWSI